MTANDRLVRFMAQLPFYIGTTTSLEVRIEVQPLLHGANRIGWKVCRTERVSLVRFYPQDQRGASGQIRGQAIRNHF